MAGISILSSRDIAITTPIPKPVIIFSGMGLEEWKKCFFQKKCETDDLSEKIAYDKCVKILMWAEFCNGILIKVGNSKNENGMNVKFTFHFPNLECRWHFGNNLEELVDIVTKPYHFSHNIV